MWKYIWTHDSCSKISLIRKWEIYFWSKLADFLQNNAVEQNKLPTTFSFQIFESCPVFSPITVGTSNISLSLVLSHSFYFFSLMIITLYNLNPARHGKSENYSAVQKMLFFAHRVTLQLNWNDFFLSHFSCLNSQEC